MPQAADYPVTFGYGATDDTYYGPQAQGKPTYIGPYHKGDDRAMPYGTPVVVNGVQIGLSGNGNGRYGAHLHIGRFVNGVDTNPNDGGFQLDGAKVVTVVDNYATDPVNAKYVRVQDANGAQWVYLHLSEVNVSAGQILQGKGEDMKLNVDQFKLLYYMTTGKQATDSKDVMNNVDGNGEVDFDTFVNNLRNYSEYKGFHFAAEDYPRLEKAYNDLKAAGSGDKVQIGTINGKPVYGDK